MRQIAWGQLVPWVHEGAAAPTGAASGGSGNHLCGLMQT